MNYYVYVNIPNDIKDLINNTELFLPPNCPDNKYIWSRCLTEMREKSIESSDIRIFAGGKCEGYLGKMPGVLEEFLIAVKEQKPVFLIGGLGGLTHKLCNSIQHNCLADEFTEEWQISHNESYQDLQKIALEHNKHADYEKIKSVIEHISINDLAQQVGLTPEEYERLMTTPFIDEAIHLILKGSKFLSEHQEKS